MKIEKVNENQIRCTLTREDLADRQLKLSELAYGSEKAKELFRDMIQQANYESVILWVFEANTRARKFYEKHGFELTKQKKLANGIAELMYMKKI